MLFLTLTWIVSPLRETVSQLEKRIGVHCTNQFASIRGPGNWPLMRIELF